MLCVDFHEHNDTSRVYIYYTTDLTRTNVIILCSNSIYLCNSVVILRQCTFDVWTLFRFVDSACLQWPVHQHQQRMRMTLSHSLRRRSRGLRNNIRIISVHCLLSYRTNNNSCFHLTRQCMNLAMFYRFLTFTRWLGVAIFRAVCAL